MNETSFESMIDKKLNEDTEFQATLEGKTDEEKNDAVLSRRKELFESEWKSITETSKKHEESYNSQKVRAEKAEGKLKATKSEERDLSTDDIISLIEAKVPKEDIADVREYALLKKIPIAEALNASLVKTILADKAEKRQTANATTTRSTRTSTQKDGNTILDEMRSKGEDAVPDADSKGSEELFWARRPRAKRN